MLMPTEESQKYAEIVPVSPRGGGGGACWPTVYRRMNKGPQNLPLTVCSTF